MPRLNGVEATKVIKTMINYDNIPIIALTANVFPEHISEYLHSGMKDFLVKPIDINHFKKIIAKHLLG